MANLNRQLGGLKAKRNGTNFETLIERTCINYSKDGFAEITKTPEPMRVVKAINRARGQYLATFEGKAQPDFTGTLSSGRSVMFEAKHVEGQSIRFDRINVKQTEYLDNHNALGAECFVILSFEMKTFYKVPWTIWKDLPEKLNKKSVNKKDIPEFEIKYLSNRLNFLEV